MGGLAFFFRYSFPSNPLRYGRSAGLERSIFSTHYRTGEDCYGAGPDTLWIWFVYFVRFPWSG
jgi:hypothetical protein